MLRRTLRNFKSGWTGCRRGSRAILARLIPSYNSSALGADEFPPIPSGGRIPMKILRSLVRLAPQRNRPRTGSLTIKDFDPNSPHVVALTGTGD